MSNIIETVTQNPVMVLTNPDSYSEFYRRVKEEISAFVPDVSTAKGRAEIASVAFKVTRSKTAIDAAGKKLNEEARAQIKVVDDQRRKIREELDALADEVRRPLTEWENAEKARTAKAKEIRENVIALGNSAPSDGCDDIRDRLAELQAIELDPEILRDDLDQAIADKAESLEHLTAHLARAEKAEADAAELAKLRAEAEARELAEAEKARADAEARRVTENEDRLADQIIDYIKTVRAGTIGGTSYPYGILLRELEIKIPLEDYAERHRQRIADAKQEAHEYLTAQMERDAAIRAEREAAEAKAREDEAAQRARDEAEKAAAERVAAAEAEAARVKADAEHAERERLAHVEQTKREETARQADRAHRSAVMKEAKEAIMAHGIDEDAAKKIVLAIVAGEVPHVTLRF